MQDIRYCVSCRLRWVPGAKRCAACGFVPPDPKPVDTASHRSGLIGLWYVLLGFGVAAIAIALFDTGTFVLRDMTSHGSYRLWGQRRHDQDMIHLSAVGSVVLLMLALLVTIIRVVRREERAVCTLIVTLCMLLVSCLLTLGEVAIS